MTPTETSGYVPCGCRDCMEIAIGPVGQFCSACEDAGCEPGEECSAPGAYGGDPEQQAHDDILRLCGETPPGGWVMRQAPSNPIKGYEWATKYRVLNLSRGTVAPYREIVAEGDTWADVLERITTGEGS